MGSAFRRCIVLMLVASLFSAGCTRTRESKVARLDLPLMQRSQPVRHGGTYVAKWTWKNRKGLKTIPGSAVTALPGDELGFERGDDGRLKARHGSQTFPLNQPPAGARYVVWHSQRVEQTQFGKDMQKVGEATLGVLKVTAVGALVVGIFWLKATDDDDCHDDDDDGVVFRLK